MDSIECTNCGHNMVTTDWTEHFTRDGDDFDIDCVNCGETHNIYVSIDVSYEII